MAWILARPGVVAAVAGASTPAQLEDPVAAASLQPAAETLAKLDALSKCALQPVRVSPRPPPCPPGPRSPRGRTW
jgi:aryl-alcohol dehydrogenase-like predicted oxidoreductase